MTSISPRPLDYWRVNSYGYPNPLIEDIKSQEAWETYQSFCQHNSYSKLKEYWASAEAPRNISSHAVESWKATFEEFGLLYVLTRSDQINITPAGRQYISAAEDADQSKLAWIGLNLLMRYPLRGPRRPKSDNHADSDLLLYRFLYSAIHDLNDYFWWSELERILCRVFHTDQAPQAVEDVKRLRSDPSLLTQFPIPANKRQGGLYNSLNQVVVHASMNHMLLTRETSSSHYDDSEPKRRHLITREWLPLIREALNIHQPSSQCQTTTSAVSRLPRAPSLADEEAYFDYLGASVPQRGSALAGTPLPQLSVGGDTVVILSEGKHFELVSENQIKGNILVLCKLSVGQRIVLSTDQRWTYIVQSKQLLTSDTLSVGIRRARPISDSSIFLNALDDQNA